MEKHRGIPGYDGEENLPREAYYSVYFYFPQYVGHDGWFWNVFQWKRAFITNGGSHSRHPTWVINVLDSGPNRMTFMLERKVDANNKYQPYGTREATAPIDVPTGQWVHLECFYKWSMNADGRITCWQDGTKIWDITNAETDLDYPYLFDKWQWSVNNYAADTTPTSHSLWIDDAAISTQRLGPNWIDGSPAVGDGDCAGLVPTIVGTPSDDRIVGTPGRDVILARGGHDVIFGRGGNDVICAGSGDDIVLAGPGRDFVYGGRGADRLSGRAGFDRLYGRHGSDRMFGGAGPDLCVGGTGRDRAASCETRR